MGELDIQEVFGIIERSNNPEIHHYNHGSHPGARWYIKTILPDRSMALDTCLDMIDAWQSFAKKHENLVLITPVGYHWTGEIMPGWHTIWLDNSIDIVWSASNGIMSFEMIEHDAGMRASAKRILAELGQDGLGSPWLDKVQAVTSMLGTYASRDHIKRKRSAIRVI